MKMVVVMLCYRLLAKRACDCHFLWEDDDDEEEDALRGRAMRFS